MKPVQDTKCFIYIYIYIYIYFYIYTHIYIFTQQREKATRHALRANFTAEQKELMSTVAFKMNIDSAIVEEAVVNCEKVIILSVVPGFSKA